MNKFRLLAGVMVCLSAIAVLGSAGYSAIPDPPPTIQGNVLKSDGSAFAGAKVTVKLGDSTTAATFKDLVSSTNVTEVTTANIGEGFEGGFAIEFAVGEIGAIAHFLVDGVELTDISLKDGAGNVSPATVPYTLAKGSQVLILKQGAAVTTTTAAATTTTTVASTTTTVAGTTTTTVAGTTTTTVAGTTTTTVAGTTTTTVAGTTTTTLPTTLTGDVSGNGVVSIYDALLVAKHDVGLVSAGPPATPLTGDALTRANVDGDTDVDIWDALKIAGLATSTSTTVK